MMMQRVWEQASTWAALAVLFGIPLPCVPMSDRHGPSELEHDQLECHRSRTEKVNAYPVFRRFLALLVCQDTSCDHDANGQSLCPHTGLNDFL